MNVGVVMSHLDPKQGGGYTFEHDVLAALSAHASETRHDFIVLGHSEKPSFDFENQKVRYAALQRPAFERLAAKMDRMIGRPRLGWTERRIAELDIDILWHVGPSCLSMEFPFITTVWDVEHRTKPFFPEVSLEGQWEARERHYACLRRAAYVVTGTQAGKNQIKEFYQVADDRIRILPHPTPRFALEALVAADEGILKRQALEKGFLFYPAQFWPHKNHATLLAAVRLLKERHQVKYLMVFSGADKGNERYIRRLAGEWHLEDQIRFVGFITTAELVALYQNAAALTYVSFCGPENLPPLEAFALECPVIASKITGAEEQLGDAAFFVPPADPEATASAILRLCTDPSLRQKHIQLGRHRASRWTSRDFVRGVFAILDEFEPMRKMWATGEFYRQLF